MCDNFSLTLSMSKLTDRFLASVSYLDIWPVIISERSDSSFFGSLLGIAGRSSDLVLPIENMLRLKAKLPAALLSSS